MLVCGIELTANEAVICLLSHQTGVFNVPDCRQRLFTFPKSATTEDLRDFHFAFNKLMEDYQVDAVAVIERPLKGKLAGSAISFKLETAIQLSSLPVSLINPSVIKEQTKRNPLLASVVDLGLKAFQQQALNGAYAYHCTKLYPAETIGNAVKSR